MIRENKRTLLVIEDNELNRDILTEILSSSYNVLQAENGKKGFELLTEYGNQISLILLDIQMPVMNGYEFLDMVQKDKRFVAIPIIVTTSSDSISDEIRCLSNGATDFVTKPYEPEVVLKRIESIIRLSETSALLKKVEYDDLTGVYSREFFYNHATRALERNPEESFDIICCDIESFKLLNDRYGTEKCDEVLKTIADLIVKNIGEDEICGRISADVFAVLLNHREDYGENGSQIEPKKLSERLPISNVVVKFGIYNNVPKDQDISKLCDGARLAIESIKGRYGMYCAMYDDHIRKKVMREQEILECMESALEEQQFLVYYQPKHHLLENATGGAEALVRWIHPEMGFMNPGEFISLFEKNGFISRLDLYVWEKVCKAIRGWLDKGIKLVPISVNVSRADFEVPRLDEVIENLVGKYQIPKELLHLEVTESAYSVNPGKINGIVESLREKGFYIELDDFGAGYSSLNTLNELVVDALKLDMGFVRKLTSERQKIIVAMIINMSKNFRMSTVAEGVETQEQESLLKSMGCTYGQGYLYAKPMPQEQFEQYLISRDIVG